MLLVVIPPTFWNTTHWWLPLTNENIFLSFISFAFPLTVPYQSTIFKRLNNNDCWYHMLWAFYIEQRWFVSLAQYREKSIKYGVQHAVCVRLEVGISVGRLSTHCFRHYYIRTNNNKWWVYQSGWNWVIFCRCDWWKLLFFLISGYV